MYTHMMSKGWNFRHRLAVFVTAVIGAAAATSLAGTADAAPASDQSATTVRTITDAASGERLLVRNDGDCARVSVEQMSTGYDDEGIVHTLTYGVDANCHVEIIGSATAPIGAADGQKPLEVASATGGPTPQQKSQVRDVESVTPAACGTWGNVVHSSHTLQDVVNIDIAKYRYGHDRNWNTCNNTTLFLQGWWMTSSTSMSWNHPSGNPVIDTYDSSWHTYAANGYGHGAFHSDFLWCNFQPGQDFILYNNNVSYASGSYDAHFSQSRTCSGTHTATAKKADTIRASW